MAASKINAGKLNEEEAAAVAEINKIKIAQKKLDEKMAANRDLLGPKAKELLLQQLAEDPEVRTVVFEADGKKVEFQFQDSFSTKASEDELKKAGVDYSVKPVFKFKDIDMKVAEEIMAIIEKKYGPLTKSLVELSHSISIEKGTLAAMADKGFSHRTANCISQKAPSIK